MEITKTTTAAFNQRGLEVRRARADLKARLKAVPRGPGTMERAMAVLADEFADGVPSFLRGVSLDTALCWAPRVEADHRALIAEKVPVDLTVTLGAMTERQVWILGLVLLGRRVGSEDHARQRIVDLAPLRDAFLRSGVKASDVARRLDWRTPKGYADGYRVRRSLGLVKYSPGHGLGPRARDRCSEDMAERLAVAIGVDLAEVGL